jgi:WD40 repeat protein
LASASQDSTVRIWDVQTHRLIETLASDQEFECLRVAWLPFDNTRDSSDRSGGGSNLEKYMLAAAGADGVLRLYSATNSNDKLQWKLVGSKDHYGLLNETEDRPQIYSLQFVMRPPQSNTTTTNDNTNSDWLLMTSADNALFFWNIPNATTGMEITLYSTIQFDTLGPNQFGGQRNPTNEIYIFDAAINNDLIAAALSDGTCRVLPLSNAKSQSEEECVLTVPQDGRGGHLTAISWGKDRLVTCIACGRVVVWNVQMVGGRVESSFVAVFDGGE